MAQASSWHDWVHSGRGARLCGKKRVVAREWDLGAALDEPCGAEGWRRRRVVPDGAPRPSSARRCATSLYKKTAGV